MSVSQPVSQSVSQVTDQIAGDILRENGTAVDAAVAALVCNGVYNSHSMGLGGGFLLTLYNRYTLHHTLLPASLSGPQVTPPASMPERRPPASPRSTCSEETLSSPLKVLCP